MKKKLFANVEGSITIAIAWRDPCSHSFQFFYMIDSCYRLKFKLYHNLLLAWSRYTGRVLSRIDCYYFSLSLFRLIHKTTITILIASPDLILSYRNYHSIRIKTLNINFYVIYFHYVNWFWVLTKDKKMSFIEKSSHYIQSLWQKRYRIFKSNRSIKIQDLLVF